MEDLGAPISYLVLAEGVPVYDSAGEHVGDVEHVLAVPDDDIFDGIVLDSKHFADSEQVAELHEKGVILNVPASELHEPSQNAPAMDAGEDLDSPLQARLRRAWDYLSGNY